MIFELLPGRSVVSPFPLENLESGLLTTPFVMFAALSSTLPSPRCRLAWQEYAGAGAMS
jgi:hypothetical protein